VDFTPALIGAEAIDTVASTCQEARDDTDAASLMDGVPTEEASNIVAQKVAEGGTRDKVYNLTVVATLDSGDKIGHRFEIMVL
jgi:hypothetical protein